MRCQAAIRLRGREACLCRKKEEEETLNTLPQESFPAMRAIERTAKLGIGRRPKVIAFTFPLSHLVDSQDWPIYREATNLIIYWKAVPKVCLYTLSYYQINYLSSAQTQMIRKYTHTQTPTHILSSSNTRGNQSFKNKEQSSEYLYPFKRTLLSCH